MSTGLRSEIKHLRLACAVPNPDDGTSYHRAIGPLSAMARQDPRLELWLPQRPRNRIEGWNLGWDWVAPCDAVFLQRPYSAVHLQFARQVKAMERPLWVEWDDLLWDVPRSNSSHECYENKQEVRQTMEKIYALADVVTTATKPLAAVLGPKARVIPNAAHCKFYNERRQRIVAWRGSETHEEDVGTVLDQMGEVAHLPQFSLWTWHFSGGVPWTVFQKIPQQRLEQSGGTGPVFFVPFLSLLAPWVLVAPLANSLFNRCKSNLAWIEATCAGAVVLAPDMEEWRRPGIVNYQDAKDFAVKLRGLIEEFTEDQEYHPLVEKSRCYVEANLRLSIVNEQRWELLNELI